MTATALLVSPNCLALSRRSLHQLRASLERDTGLQTAAYLQENDYPEAAALSFVVMAAILVIVFIYIRAAGTEAFIGEEAEEEGAR